MKKYIIVVILISSNFALKAQNEVEQFREPFSKSFPIRKEQHLEIKDYVEGLMDENTDISLNKFQPDYYSIEDYKNSLYPYRKALGKYFGYPPPKAIKGKITKFEKAGEDKYSTIHRVWIEVIEGVHAYGLYLVPKNHNDKVPLIVAIHGGGGNPEAIVGLDTRINYHNFGYEAVKRGYAVWAPGLTMLSGYAKDPKIPGVSREMLDSHLNKIGSSIIGLEILKIIASTKTIIDSRSEIDASNVGMTGLSWGGFFTMYTTALAPFIKAAAPSGNFRDTKNNLEKLQNNNSNRYTFEGFGHFQAIGMICPRPCLVQLGENDTLFDLDGARTEAKRAKTFYDKLGIPDKFIFDVHQGGHEFRMKA